MRINSRLLASGGAYAASRMPSRPAAPAAAAAPAPAPTAAPTPAPAPAPAAPRAGMLGSRVPIGPQAGGPPAPQLAGIAGVPGQMPHGGAGGLMPRPTGGMGGTMTGLAHAMNNPGAEHRSDQGASVLQGLLAKMFGAPSGAPTPMAAPEQAPDAHGQLLDRLKQLSAAPAQDATSGGSY